MIACTCGIRFSEDLHDECPSCLKWYGPTDMTFSERQQATINRLRAEVAALKAERDFARSRWHQAETELAAYRAATTGPGRYAGNLRQA